MLFLSGASMNVGAMLAFIMLVGIFFILPRSIVSARRIVEVLTREQTIVFCEQTCGEQEAGNVAVEFNNVTFGYGKNPCIENISFKISEW